MKHSTRLLSPAQCLWQALWSLPLAASRLPRCQITRIQPAPQRTLYVDRRRNARMAAIETATNRLSGFTKDEDIDTAQVQIKQDDGNISDPQPLFRLLRSIDREKQVVIQLSKPGEREASVVEICDKDGLRKRVRDQEKATKQQVLASKDKKPKQLELNWAISEHDLEMKLKQLEQFLGKGKKVEILLAAKRRQRKATPEEGQAVLQKIRAKVAEIDAKEVKPMDGEVLRQALLTIGKKDSG